MGYDAISMHWLGVSTNVGTQEGGRANSGFQVSQWQKVGANEGNNGCTNRPIGKAKIS